MRFIFPLFHSVYPLFSYIIAMIFVMAKIVDLFRVPGGTPPSWRTQMASELSKGPWRGPGKSSPKEEIGATRVGKIIYIYI